MNKTLVDNIDNDVGTQEIGDIYYTQLYSELKVIEVRSYHRLYSEPII